MIENWQGRRVTVMGLGRFGGGVGATRWLARQGARVLVTDLAPPENLRDALDRLAGLDVELRLGRHKEDDFRRADLVVVNPAVPESSGFLQAARDGGVPVTTEINLFVERCPARCIGVSGSAGKSTVTAMIGHLLRHTLSDRRVWVGGNVGRSLLEELDRIGPDHLVVLELSSFQLARTPAVGWSPHIAVLTNLAPNHLDWHGSFTAYAHAKLNILRFQNPARDVVILGDDPELHRQVQRVPGGPTRAWTYGLDQQAAGGIPVAGQGSVGEQPQWQRQWPELQLSVPGRHNRHNAAAALLVAELLDVAPDAACAALASFPGLPHRLQRVVVRDGVSYYDDSKATTPEAVLIALEALDGPLLVILGGYDKGIDLTVAAQAVARRASFAACIGQTGNRLAAAIRAAGGTAERCADLTAAVAACRRHASPGDTVLLSPGCASWDMFADYRQRGCVFARLARELP